MNLYSMIDWWFAFVRCVVSSWMRIWQRLQVVKWSVGYSKLTSYLARAPAPKAMIVPWASRALGVLGGMNREGTRSWSLGKKPHDPCRLVWTSFLAAPLSMRFHGLSALVESVASHAQDRECPPWPSILAKAVKVYKSQVEWACSFFSG